MMKVYIVRDNFLSDEVYSEVLETLESVKGIIDYTQVDMKISLSGIDETSATDNSLSAEEIFTAIDEYRNYDEHKVNNDEFIVLLSEVRHSKNWFSIGANAIDKTTKNIYVNTSIWSELLELEKVSAIVHEIMANLMQLLMFNDHEDTMKHVHHKPIGCFNDFCGNIEDVKINMRTADVCEDCQKIIEEKDINRVLFVQVMDTLELVRKNMLAVQRFKRSIRDCRIEINNRGKFIALDLNNQEIKFSPRAKTLYHLFLERGEEESLFTNDLEKHKDRLIALYKLYALSRKNHDNAENIVNKIIDTNDNTFSEITTSIRKELSKVFGDKNISVYELKQGDDDKFKIKLDRKNVIVNNHPRKAVTNQFGY